MKLEAWKPYVPSHDRPWNLERVKHLHRRGGFGATCSEILRDLADGPQESVARVLDGRSRLEGQAEAFEETAGVIADAAIHSGDPQRLKAWWLFRMLVTPDPLREKLTLLWHNHFATSNRKVQSLQRMRTQNELFRTHATGRFADMLRAVLHDPAMLHWLDAPANRKGHPNENLARELMELFTLGIGNFGESDVREAARALTGWVVKRDQAQFRSDRFDEGDKMVLGVRGPLGIDQLQSILLEHEATSHRLAWRLCSLLMGEGVVGEAERAELATELRARQLDIGWAVETILRSELFFAPANLGSRVSSPVEFMLGAIRSLNQLDPPPSTLLLAEWCGQLGQDLFYPPNVGGWGGGRGWLSSRTIVARSNFAAALAAGRLWSPARPLGLQQLVQQCDLANGDGSSPGQLLATLLVSDPSNADDSLPAGKDLSEQLARHAARLLSSPEGQLT